MSLSVCGQSVLACAHEELQQKGNQRELRVVIPSRQVSNEGGKGVRERERKTLVETRQMRILNAGGA